MNVADVVNLLEKNGVKRTTHAIKYLASKFNLYNDNNKARPGLDPNKIKKLVAVLTSPNRVAEIARQYNCSYSKVNYYILKNHIAIEKIYGNVIIKKDKDAEYVKSFL